MIRTFHLLRTLDPGGVSGIGLVAEGVELTGGVCILHWIADPTKNTLEIHPTVTILLSIHGHIGTSLVWDVPCA